VDAADLPEHVAPQAPDGGKGKGDKGGFFDSLLGGGSKARGAKQETDGGFSMMISAPFNVQHNIHVQVDPASNTGFKGLPPEWDAMLSASGISKAEISAHPQAVLDILQFHMEGPPAPPTPPKLPKRDVLGAWRSAQRTRVAEERDRRRGCCSGLCERPRVYRIAFFAPLTPPLVPGTVAPSLRPPPLQRRSWRARR
jgi:hypothetical protein